MNRPATETPRLNLGADPELLKFSSEEVTEIIRRATMHQDEQRDGRLSYRELLHIGRDLGVESDDIRAAIAGFERDRRRDRVIKRRRTGFLIHAAVYATVNLGLLGINLLTSPQYLWFLFPVFGWGIGLLCHGAAVYFANRQTPNR